MSRLIKLLPWMLAACMSQALALDRDQFMREEALGRGSVDTLPPAPLQRVRPRITLPTTGAILVADVSLVPLEGGNTQWESRIIALDTSAAVLDPNFIVDPNLLEPQNAILSPDGTEIWVSNRVPGTTDEVRAYDLSGNPAGALISGNAQVNAIGGIALSPDDTLLVPVSQPTDAVLEFDSSGALIGTFINNLGSVDGPADILLRRDPVTQEPVEYLVSGFESGTVGRFDLSGNYKNGEDLVVPRARQVSQALEGNILVASMGRTNDPENNDGAIFEFTPGGAAVNTYSLTNLNLNRQFRGVLEIPSEPFRGLLLGTTREQYPDGDAMFLQGGIRVIRRSDSALVATVLPEFVFETLSLAYAELILPTQLLFSKTPNSTVLNAGDTLIYTLSVDNTSSNALNNLVVTDSIPAGVEYVSNDCGQPAPVNDEFTWTVGTLAAGQALTCTVETLLSREILLAQPLPVELVNIATADADELVEPVTSSATVSVVGDSLIFRDQFEDAGTR